MIAIIRFLLIAYEFILLARVISTWIRVPPSGPMRRFMDIVYDLTEPVLRPLRNAVPPLRMGMVALDLSIIIVFIVISILLAYI
jgi:YggT family protein